MKSDKKKKKKVEKKNNLNAFGRRLTNWLRRVGFEKRFLF